MSLIKAFLYARKSTDSEDRQVYSIEHQIRELRELASRIDIHIVAELIEHRSAKMPGRPVFDAMLRRMKQGQATVILAWHPDRLARNAVDGGQIIHLVDTGVVTDLKFVNYWFEPTPQGMLMLSIAFGMSKYYVDSLSQGVKHNYRQRIADGFWPRRPPLGYLFDRNIRQVVLDHVQAPFVREVFQLYATGDYSLERMALVMTAKGLRSRRTRKHGPLPLSLSQFHFLLQNPFYAGVMRFRGELHPGKHPALITTNLFDRCQIILAQRGKRITKCQLPCLYRKLFRCAECGCMITASRHKGHMYLRCTKKKGPCSQLYLREDDAQRQIAQIVQRLVIPEAIGSALIAQLQTQQRKDTAGAANDVRRIDATITRYDEKVRRLTDAYVDGTLTANEFRVRKDKLVLARQKSVEILTTLKERPLERLEPAIRFIRVSMKAQTVAESGDPVQQRDLFQKAGSNLFVRDGKIVWEARGAWKHVVNAGFFRNRPSAPAGFVGTPSTIFSSWSAMSSAARRLHDGIATFFGDDPSWV
jgi:site-specific DNA recombinase